MTSSSFRALGALAGISVAVMAAVPALADVKAGVDAWSRGEYNKAVDEWRPAAIAGDPDAQFDLAQAYKLGRGVPVDLAMAEQWYGRAALQGHPEAEASYGLALFQNGKREEAVPWLEKSVARGEPRAELILGTMLFNGDAVKKDWVRAYALLVRSSSTGLPQARKTRSQMEMFLPIDTRQQGMVLARQYEDNLGGFGDQPQVAAITAALPGTKAGNGSAMRNAAFMVPASRQTSALSADPSPAAPVSPVQARPATNGNWRIQLGAFGDATNAYRLWGMVGDHFPSHLPYFVKTGALTRLLVGPYRTSAEASRACGAIKPCVAVAAR